MNDSSFENFLLDFGIISAVELVALRQQLSDRQTIADRLIAEGKLENGELQRLRALHLGVPFNHLDSHQIAPELLFLIPESIARKHNIIAFDQVGDTLKIALLNLDDLRFVDFLKHRFKLQAHLVVENEMRQVLRHYQQQLRERFIQSDELNVWSEIITGQMSQELKNQKQAESPLAKHLLNKILSQAEAEGASDIFFWQQNQELTIKFRIRGKIYQSLLLTEDKSEVLIKRLKYLLGWSLTEIKQQSSVLELELNDEKRTFIIHSIPIIDGEKISLHLKQNQSSSHLSELGLDGINLELVHQALQERSGLILLISDDKILRQQLFYALLSSLDYRDLAIATVEEKVTQNLPFIAQTQIDKNLSMTNAIRAVMKQDDDVLGIDEVRNGEAAELLAANSSQRKLIIATVDATDRDEVIEKIKDWDLNSVLRLVLVQKSISTLDENKEQYFLDKKEIKELESKINSPKLLQFLKQMQLIKPKQTWSSVAFYRTSNSRQPIGAYEVYPAVLLKSKTDKNLSQTLKDFLFKKSLTLTEDAVLKAAVGKTSLEEAIKTK